MKIVAVTACPTGIAHTYMAADALKKAAQKKGYQIKVETQGAMGIENQLTVQDIARADMIIIASDIVIEQGERFTGANLFNVSIEEVLLDAETVIEQLAKQTNMS